MHSAGIEPAGRTGGTTEKYKNYKNRPSICPASKTVRKMLLVGQIKLTYPTLTVVAERVVYLFNVNTYIYYKLQDKNTSKRHPAKSSAGVVKYKIIRMCGSF